VSLSSQRSKDQQVLICLALVGFLHNPDLLFRQPVKLVDQGIDLPVRGLDQAACQGRLFVRCGRLEELFMQGEHSFHQEGHAVLAGDVGGTR